MSRKLLLITILAVLISIFPLTAYANSSWSWLTETTPIAVLPFAVVFTLAVEIFAIIKFGCVKRRLKAALIVTVANLVSFLLPLLFNWLIVYPMEPEMNTTLSAFINEVPFYIVGFGFLTLTLIIELPIVYFTLKHDTTYPVRLIIAALASNIITTTAIAVVEHILCVRALY